MIALQQLTALRPFMGQLVILAKVAMRAGNDKIGRIVSSSARERNDMINMIVFSYFLTAIIASAILMGINRADIRSGMSTLRGMFSGTLVVTNSPYFIWVVCSPVLFIQLSFITIFGTPFAAIFVQLFTVTLLPFLIAPSIFFTVRPIVFPTSFEIVLIAFLPIVMQFFFGIFATPFTRIFPSFFLVNLTIFLAIFEHFFSMICSVFSIRRCIALFTSGFKPIPTVYVAMKELRSRRKLTMALRTALVSGGYCDIIVHSHRSFEALAHTRSIRVLPGLLTSPAYYTSEAT